MDHTILVAELVGFLTPFLPYLLKVGEKATEEAAKRLGGDTWERAKSLWSLLNPKIEAKPTAREAVHDAASAPNDEDARAALRIQLKKLLAEDQTLAQALAASLSAAQNTSVTTVTSGDRGISVGHDVSGGILNTGDNPTLSKE